MAALCRHCAIPSLSHLLGTDVYHHTTMNDTPNLFGWHSPFVSKIQQAGDAFLMTLTSQHKPFPPLSWLLAHSPIPTGGIGFRDHCDTAIASFLVHPFFWIKSKIRETLQITASNVCSLDTPSTIQETPIACGTRTQAGP
jgi:hypothetical protein